MPARCVEWLKESQNNYYYFPWIKSAQCKTENWTPEGAVTLFKESFIPSSKPMLKLEHIKISLFSRKTSSMSGNGIARSFHSSGSSILLFGSDTC
jgi:hypothetical protein